MSKFRWHKGEHDSFYNKIKSFNRKIDKARQEGYSNNLPDKLDYKKELNNILSNKDYSRGEFNSKINYIENFMNKNALDIKKGTRGAKIPIWEFKDVKKQVKEINRKRMIQKHKLEEEEATDRGKKIGYKVKEIPDLATNKIREKNFNWKRMASSDFEMFKKTLWEFNEKIEDMDKQMERNYRLAVTREFDLRDAKTLIRVLDRLPQELIIRKIYNDLNLGFKFTYSKADYDEKVKALNQGWLEIEKEYKQNSKE